MIKSSVERLLQTARSQIGYLEKATNSKLNDKTSNAGSNNFTKYAADLDRLGVYNSRKNGYAWCDVFVDWCFITTFGLDEALKMINQTKGDCGAGCHYSAQYYKKAGKFYKSNPQSGDQIFFKDSSGDIVHTGIVEKVQNSRVYTIEGNTSSKSGVVANGGSVESKSYVLNYSRIAGYGRPNWEEYDMDVNRFKELWLEMRESLKDNDASNYSKEAREWATSTGLIQGSNNEEFNGMWEDILTREQLVTILYRFAKKIGQV